MNQVETLEKRNSLFIICPFCQLESFIRTNFGSEIFFITIPAVVLNFNKSEISDIRDFIFRMKIENIYVVNDISCNFLEEAINNEKVFGLDCEKELRINVKLFDFLSENHLSSVIKKEILAKSNIGKQVSYLNSLNLFNRHIEPSEKKVHGLILDQHTLVNSLPVSIK